MSQRRNIIIYALITAFVLGALAWVILSINSSHQKKDQQLQAQQQAFAQTALADPILKYLPYGDLGYNITPTFQPSGDSPTSKTKLVIKVGIILSDADYRQDSATIQARVNQREQQALAYVRSKGFDPAKYTIEYDVPSY